MTTISKTTIAQPTGLKQELKSIAGISAAISAIGAIAVQFVHLPLTQKLTDVAVAGVVIAAHILQARGRSTSVGQSIAQVAEQDLAAVEAIAKEILGTATKK